MSEQSTFSCEILGTSNMEGLLPSSPACGLLLSTSLSHPVKQGARLDRDLKRLTLWSFLRATVGIQGKV